METAELRRRVQAIDRQIIALDQERNGLMHELFLRAGAHARSLTNQPNVPARTGSAPVRLKLVPRPVDSQ